MNQASRMAAWLAVLSSQGRMMTTCALIALDVLLAGLLVKWFRRPWLPYLAWLLVIGFYVTLAFTLSYIAGRPGA